jgi:hypothetical protein
MQLLPCGQSNTSKICQKAYQLQVTIKISKGQLISKWFFGVIDFLQKMNERIRLYYYDTSTPKNHFEINWPLTHFKAQQYRHVNVSFKSFDEIKKKKKNLKFVNLCEKRGFFFYKYETIFNEIKLKSYNRMKMESGWRKRLS